MKHLSDTIMAPATYPGKSAIGIIRLSGNSTLDILKKIFSFRNPAFNFTNLKPFTVHAGTISGKNGVIDECMLSYFRGPSSYTGEDMAEISIHGNTYIIGKALELLASLGCRHAEPGEFTRRAFLNSKLGLSEAEAVADITSASNDQALKISLNQLSGSENKRISSLRESLISLLSDVESEIDFAHEDIEKTSAGEVAGRLKLIISDIEGLIRNSDAGIKLKNGFKLVITGKPNTGKSSLLNRLLEKDRAIVTDEPGTTRDTIEEPLSIGSLPFIVIDTAGIRGASSGAEKMGIERTASAIASSDIIVFLIDSSSSIDDNDLEIFRLAEGKKTVIALSKSDLPVETTAQAALKALGAPLNTPVLPVSALKNTGIETLTNTIKDIIIECGGLPSADKIIVSSLRHKACLEKARNSLLSASSSGRAGHELAAADIKEACSALSEITGEIASEEVLENIFKNFCIGK